MTQDEELDRRVLALETWSASHRQDFRRLLRRVRRVIRQQQDHSRRLQKLDALALKITFSVSCFVFAIDIVMRWLAR
jgi:hypothetical protein